MFDNKYYIFYKNEYCAIPRYIYGICNKKGVLKLRSRTHLCEDIDLINSIKNKVLIICFHHQSVQHNHIIIITNIIINRSMNDIYIPFLSITVSVLIYLRTI
jgi:hypothetical protein